MQQSHTGKAGHAWRGIPEAMAGVMGGMVAGVAYLVAQVSLTAAVRPGGGAEPFQRIAAILLGPDAALPPADFNFTLLGVAMIIHLGLAAAYGRFISALVWRRSAGAGVLIGGLAGLLLYLLNFGLIAPHAFPWFADSIRAVTVADHALFGAVAAAVCLALRRPPW